MAQYTAPGMYGMPRQPVPQMIENQSWPPDEVARTIKDHAAIDVRVRVFLSRDGDAWLDGKATRWHGRSVFVRFEPDDRRLRLPFAWLDAADVRRR